MALTTLHAFAFRMALRATATALLGSLFLLPLLHLTGAVTAAPADLILLAMFYSLLTGAVSLWMALRAGRSIERLTRSKLRFEKLSRLDELSGLLNRRAFAEELAKAPPGASLVMVDIDRFKAINDTHGHAVGDDVIRQIADLIRDSMGAETPAARLGGEEFGILLNSGDVEQRIDLVEGLRRRVENRRFGTALGEVSVTISAGLSESVPEKDLALVYAAADKALYLAKASGRNRVVHGAAGLNVILDLVAAGMAPGEGRDLADGRGVA